MKLPMDAFEAALRQKRQAAGEVPRPPRRAQRRGRAEPARAEVVPAVPGPSMRPSRETPAEEATPAPTKAPITAAAAVVVLDPEEEGAPAADVPEVEQVTVATGPPVPAGPEAEGELSHADRGVTDERPLAGAGTSAKRRRETRSLSPRSSLRQKHPRVDGPQKGVVPPTPQYGALGNTAVADGILKRMRTSETVEEVGRLSHSAVLDMIAVAVVQMGHGAITLRERLLRSGDSLSKTVDRADKYKKRSVALARDLAELRQEVQAREEGLVGQVKEAESQAFAAKAELTSVSAKLCAADAQVEDLARRLRHAEGQTKAAQSEALAARERAAAAERAVVEVGERAAAAEKAAVEAGHEKAGAEAYANEANARAEEAECRALEAEARVEEAECRALAAEARVEEAEVKAQQAEAQAKQAVADFKSSAEFEQEVVEASLDAYVKGFESCKAKVSAAFNISAPDLEGIQAGDLGEAPAEEEEEGREESGPGEP